MFGGKKTTAGPIDWVVTGLGNPGGKYEMTRHNAGFMALDRLSDIWNIPVKKLGFRAVYGMGRFEDVRVLLLKPQTFMNLSGESLRDCLSFYKIPLAHAIVIHDDVSLPVGRIRIRTQGSDGGHNGIKNILYHARSDAFPRVKIGVGAPPHPEYALIDWVLGKFSKEDQPILSDAIDRACAAVGELIKNGSASAMNRYN
jgi:PTH1 family peptidyl-tRNA hydrolase